MTAPTVSTVFAAVKDVTTGLFGLVGDCATAIVGNPILMIGIGIGLVSLGVGLFHKFVR
jgi:hypothetical protein